MPSGGEETLSAPVPESIAAPAIRGSLWTMGGYAASQLLRLGSNLVLTRLLFPSVFGEMALVFLFIQGLQMFSDVGIGPAIVQSRRGDDRTFLNTAWTIQCARGGVLWVASCAIAWPIAAFYDRPMLRWLIPAAGFTAMLAGLESTSVRTLQRQLRFEKLTVLDLTSQTLGILAVILAALGDRWLFGPNDPYAVWAIIAGSFVSSLTRLIMSHLYLPGIRNRFELDRRAKGQLFRFGRWIFVSTFLTFLAAQADRLVFGKTIPIALFGVYSIAAMLAALPTNAVLKLGGSVVFPAYSRLASRPNFDETFWRVRRPLLFASAALVSGLVVGGPFLVRVLYDVRYAQAGWILQYLAVMAWFQILESTIGAALLAKGHVKWVAAGSASKVAGMVLAIPAGFLVGGFPGALAGLVASEAVKYFTAAAGAAAAAGLRVLGRDLSFTLGVAAASTLGILAGRWAIARGSGDFLALSTSLLVVGASWAAIAARVLRRSRLALWNRVEEGPR